MVGVVITSIAVRAIATWSDADYILDVIQTTLDATLMRAAQARTLRVNGSIA